jgi:hypothetical protein
MSQMQGLDNAENIFAFLDIEKAPLPGNVC